MNLNEWRNQVNSNKVLHKRDAGFGRTMLRGLQEQLIRWKEAGRASGMWKRGCS